MLCDDLLWLPTFVNHEDTKDPSAEACSYGCCTPTDNRRTIADAVYMSM